MRLAAGARRRPTAKRAPPMLGTIRQATKSWASKIVIGILALSFAAFGINDVFTGGSRSSVATVGEVEVPTLLFDRQFQRALQNARNSYGRADLTREEAHRMGLTGQVLSSLIREHLLDAEAHRLGLRAADGEVRQELERSAAFADETGAFDAELYDLVLARNNMTRSEYEDLIRVDLLRDQIGRVIGADRGVPFSLANALHRHRAERRNARLAPIPSNGMTGIPEPTAEEIAAYYEENTALYMAPERRSATAVRLSAEAMVSEIELSDDDVYAEYEERIDEFDLPEQRAVVQINASDKTLIDDGARMLTEGTPFKEVAQRLESRGATVIERSDVESDGPVKAASDAIFALAEGEASGPVQTTLGWHLFKVSGITPARTQGFEEVREELHEEMALDLAGAGLFRLSTVLEDELGGGASLELAAAAVGADVLPLQGIDRNGHNRAGSPALDGLAERDEILALLFRTPDGGESPVVELDDGSFVVLRVDAVEEPAPRPLEEVRTQVRTALLRTAEGKAAEQVAEALANRIRAGETLEDAAADAGFASDRLDGVTRDGTGAPPGTAPGLIRGLFAKSRGDTEPIVAATADGWVVAVLDGVTDADGGDNDEDHDRVRTELARAWSDDVAAVYRNALYDRHDISINDALIAQLVGATQ